MADAPKRKRIVTPKPFMVQAAISDVVAPDGTVIHSPKELWGDVLTPPEITTAAQALKYIEDTMTIPAGRYRVIQLCADQVKHVEHIQKTTMTPTEEEPAGSSDGVSASPEVA